MSIGERSLPPERSPSRCEIRTISAMMPFSVCWTKSIAWRSAGFARRRNRAALRHLLERRARPGSRNERRSGPDRGDTRGRSRNTGPARCPRRHIPGWLPPNPRARSTENAPGPPPHAAAAKRLCSPESPDIREPRDRIRRDTGRRPPPSPPERFLARRERSFSSPRRSTNQASLENTVEREKVASDSFLCPSGLVEKNPVHLQRDPSRRQLPLLEQRPRRRRKESRRGHARSIDLQPDSAGGSRDQGGSLEYASHHCVETEELAVRGARRVR